MDRTYTSMFYVHKYAVSSWTAIALHVLLDMYN